MFNHNVSDETGEANSKSTYFTKQSSQVLKMVAVKGMPSYKLN
jgi:hypothetical protein